MAKERSQISRIRSWAKPEWQHGTKRECLSVLVVLEYKCHQTLTCIEGEWSTFPGSYKKPDRSECWRQENQKGVKSVKNQRRFLGRNHFCRRERPLGRKSVHDGGKERRSWRKRTIQKQERSKEAEDDRSKRQNLLKKLNFSGAGEEGLPKPRNKVSYPSHPSHTATGYCLFKNI